MPGRVLANRYEMLGKVGEGGMAVVYRARDQLLGRLVAIKVLRGQFAGDEDFIERFRREAQAAASLSHPNVVNIFDVGEEDGTYFIVMEYIEGSNLKEVIRREGALPVPTAVFIAKEVARGLEAAHRQGLIHRDVKPHNILLTKDGRVKVTDFGIARATSTATLTHTGTVIGSVHYFSPEQARGGHVGVQSDLYSLGVLMYEMVTGRLPFSGDSPVAVALKHLQEEPVPASRVNPDVSPELDGIIARAMAKDESHRYRQANDVLRDLRRIPSGDEGTAGYHGDRLASEAEEAGGDATRLLSATDGETRPLPVELLPPDPEEDDMPSRKKRPRRRLVAWSLFWLFFLGGVAWAASALPALIFPAEVRVPDVRGKSVAQAQAILRQEGLRLQEEQRVHSNEVQAGAIISQDPVPGQRVKEGRTVLVRISGGPEFVTVPDVVGLTLREAKLRMTERGLVLGSVAEEFRADLAPNTVVGQDPPGGSQHQAGYSVDLVVSKGAEPIPTVTVPDFRGQSLEAVRNRLNELGLRLGQTFSDVSDEPPSTVIDQNPAPRTEIDVGSPIDLVYSGEPQEEADGSAHTEPGPAEEEAARPNAPREQGPAGAQRPQAGAWHQAAVTIAVDQGPPQEVVILVIDDFGAREVYRQVKPGGATFTQMVQGRGDGAKIQVYIGGTMRDEQPFPK